MKRRDLIKGGLLAGLAGLIPRTGTAQAVPAPDRGAGPVGPARNIIFFAYDGFSWEDVGTAQAFARRHRSRPLMLERLFAEGAMGSMASHSLTSIVTDSAAATSAWSTGRKIVNGALAMYPDGRELTTILELAKQKGKATGLITTTTVTHATPAGWVAKIDNRRREEKIAEQYLDFRPDVVLGGGSRFFDPAQRGDGRDLYGAFAAQGYSVLRDAVALERTNASRLLGTFAADHLPYEIDRRFQGVPAPTLAEMTRKGLEVLSGYENGFVVQIEAGRIDHANHRNDVAGAVWDILAADEALAVMLEFVDRYPGTLLILASDHGTGGGAVYGVGERYRSSSQAFGALPERRASFEYILEALGAAPSPDQTMEAVRHFTGVRLTLPQARTLADAVGGRGVAPDLAAYNRQPENTLGWVLRGGDYENPDRLNHGFVTGQHTAGPVPVAAYGAGVRARPIGMVDNTALFGWMTRALDVGFENPRMSEEEALELQHTAGLRKGFKALTLA